MSYYRTIRPNDNFEKFRATGGELYFPKYTEKYILHDCMSYNSNNDAKGSDLTSFLLKLEKDINHLVSDYTYNAKVRLTKEFDADKHGEIVFCGWEYADDHDDIDVEDITNYVFNKLFILGTLVKNYDYYEENERFFDKQKEIEDLLEYLRDEIYKSVDYEVIDYYKDCVVVGDDDGEDIKAESVNEDTTTYESEDKVESGEYECLPDDTACESEEDK